MTDYLEHFGVKGMKWGVRKASQPSVVNANRPENVAKTLTDADLKKAVARLNLEKQFVTLTKEVSEREKTSKQRGFDLVSELIQTAAKQQLQQLVNKQAANILSAAISVATPTKKE